MTLPRPTIRRASRLLILDETGRILLFRYEDERGTWWATPGGGLDANESFEDAAAREAREELGATHVSLEYQWERTSEFESRGRLIRQTERYFLARTPITAVAMDNDVSDAHAMEGILATRWWSPEEIRTSAERVFPEDLGERLEQLLAPER